MSTLTAYPDAGTGSTTVDGFITSGYGATMTVAHNTSTGDGANPSHATDMYIRALQNGSGTYLGRIGLTFDTSGLTSGATISSAVLSLYGTSSYYANPSSSSAVIVAFAPASNNTLVAGDFGTFSYTSFASIAQGSLSQSAYNDFTLNASGISNISKTGISRFGCIYEVDRAITTITGVDNIFNFKPADTSGTTNDPKLVVTYSTSVDVTVSPSVKTCTFTIPSYTVTAIQNVTVSPSVQTATFSIPTHTVITSTTVSPTVQTATFSIPTYTVTIADVLIQPSVQTCTFSIPTYTPDATANPTISPSVQVCTFTIPTYTVSVVSNITISPSVLTATFSILTYTALGDYWEEKFAQPATSWSDKIAQPNTSWSNKY